MVSQNKVFQSPFKTIFFTVTNPQDKINYLLKTSYEYFENRKRLLILVSNPKAMQYVDSLLWDHSQTSFLPHDTEHQNYSKNSFLLVSSAISKSFPAQSIFNLTETPVNITNNTFSTIYEFEENSNPSKKISFQNKLNYYKSHKRRIISL